MTQAAASTAVGPMEMVAIEQHFPPEQRITTDTLARRFLPFPHRAMIHLLNPAPARDWMVRRSEKAFPGQWSGRLGRKRLIDDHLFAGQDQVEAVVNIGAGYDTRVYRLQDRDPLPAWELDLPEVTLPKRRRLEGLYGSFPAHVRLIAIDLNLYKLGAMLATYGYPQEAPTYFIWEDVSQYLTKATILATFEFLCRSAVGSRLAFTYILEDFIEGQDLFGLESVYRKHILQDQAWLSGLKPAQVEEWLESTGWQVQEHLGGRELADRYVQPTGRQLFTNQIERLVVAEKFHPCTTPGWV